MNGKNILLVEDNQDDVVLTLRAFRKNKVKNKIVTVENGEDALEYLFCKGEFEGRNPLDQPAMVLLDIKLPKLNGFEVLKEIRKNEQTKYLPVVILTISKEEHDMVYGYLLGGKQLFKKPVSFERFSEAIKTLTVFWTHINKTPNNSNKI